jgi:hypothetical protein
MWDQRKRILFRYKIRRLSFDFRSSNLYFRPGSQVSFGVIQYEKGQEMKNSQSCLAIMAAILLLASCSSIQMPFSRLKPLSEPLSEGETRLTRIEMPDYVREDLDYDVVLRYASEEAPQISRVCFRWLAVPISSVSPSLNCYAANGDFGTGNPCYAGASVVSSGSSSFCAEASDIKADIPGRLVVRIRPTGLQAGYNMLEGQAEYVHDGQLRTTNSVRTPVIMDQTLTP